MDGPRPIDEVLGTIEFRNNITRYLDKVTAGEVLAIRNEKRKIDLAVVVSPTLWDNLGRTERGLTGLSTHPDGNDVYLTRTELATQLNDAAHRIGGETYQLTAGETATVRGLLAELAGQHADEPLGQLAGEWAARLGKRTAPTA